jgi:hypothetical protein
MASHLLLHGYSLLFPWKWQIFVCVCERHNVYVTSLMGEKDTQDYKVCDFHRKTLEDSEVLVDKHTVHPVCLGFQACVLPLCNGRFQLLWAQEREG